jgi:hypothetical protein
LILSVLLAACTGSPSQDEKFKNFTEAIENIYLNEIQDALKSVKIEDIKFSNGLLN